MNKKNLFKIKLNKINKRIIYSAGFSLVEVLIALSIFSIAVTGIITVSTQGGIGINADKNRLTANYLAQEGIELMRAKRDSYVLSGTTYLSGWQNFVTDVSAACEKSCDLDVNSLSNMVPSSGQNVFYSCVVASNCNLSYSTDGFYIHGTGSPTPFNRQLTFVVFNPSGGTPSEMEVTSTVYWKEGYITRSISMNESLFNWYTPI